MKYYIFNHCQGITRRLKKVSKTFDQVLEQIIEDHENNPYDKEQKGPHNKDFIDILLSLMHQTIDDQNVIDKTNIKAIILDIINAAFDTSSITVEWALSELLKHPNAMKRLQDELENIVGMKRHVEESDLENLPYLNMVVKETLRLHPIAPLLLPRKCREDITIDGYYIKKKSRIIINAWAIGRDSKVWYNAENFDPMRFENNNIDIRGNDFRVIPFGSGRRGCPGIHLGLTTVKFVLAQLVHCFNWVLPSGMSLDELDMSEIFGITTPRKYRKEGERKSAPGPKGWPIIGNLHMLGKLPHRRLQSLATKYGPIMSLQLGQVSVIVVSSPETAELFLKKHDTVFASRPKIQASESLSHGSKGLAFSDYSAYWRSVRKVCTLQLLSASKVEMFAPLRRSQLGQLVKSLKSAAASSEVVDVSKLVGELVENIVCNMIFGCAKDDRFDLQGVIHEVMHLVGLFNLADYMPWLGAFDLQGITTRLTKVSKTFDQILEQIIQDHENNLYDKEQKGPHNKDFIDILLSLMHQTIDDQNVIDRTNIKAIILDIINAAFDTSSTTVEWALSELLKHPSTMKRLQDELENIVGMKRHVEESDLEKLPYLNMVVKETLRLHPIAPLLLPRECREDITIDGYYIKKKTRIIINAWAIGRDSKVWYNAKIFDPMRFENNNIDIRGNDFRVIPFGSGRRGCPGIHLGLTTVKFVLAQLVHCFNWVLPSGMSPDELDMSEIFGLTMPRKKHLLAIPVPTIVVSTPEIVELFLKAHDTVFASRPKTQASEYMTYGSKGLVFSEKVVHRTTSKCIKSRDMMLFSEKIVHRTTSKSST
ncbi:hypothetical protein CR513_06702, partial [Mucuna pruriens]